MLYSVDASMVFCVLCFLLCMFLLYATVLLLVGVIKDDDDDMANVSFQSRLRS